MIAKKLASGVLARIVRNSAVELVLAKTLLGTDRAIGGGGGVVFLKSFLTGEAEFSHASCP